MFPIPRVCENLTQETKQKIYLTTEKDDENSKIKGFFNSIDSMWNEMKWQRKLKQHSWLYWISSHMSFWSYISFNLAVMINLLIAFFYPFNQEIKGSILYSIQFGGCNFSLNLCYIGIGFKMNFLIWLVLISSLSLLFAFPKIEWLKKRTIPIFLASFILRLAFTIGIQPTLSFIGTLNVETNF